MGWRTLGALNPSPQTLTRLVMDLLVNGRFGQVVRKAE
ncbi:hypothetical protein H4W33_003083 [Kibdelosporangium phytohabitans]|nr:hypothetical protein [Kibdelosporangium phytohabitans]